jgi:hypothetical protein
MLLFEVTDKKITTPMLLYEVTDTNGYLVFFFLTHRHNLMLLFEVTDKKSPPQCSSMR